MAESAKFLIASSEFDRRFRALLCADIVGYTRLMETDELETHVRARTLRVSTIDPIVVSHRGEVVKNTGDGFIAVFESPLDAVRCAAELQTEIATHEKPYPPERRIQLRMGLHWQRVILDERDVFGSGVNVSARLQAAAPNGGVVISETLHKLVGEQAGTAFDDLGALSLKNLSRPIRAYAMVLPGVQRGEASGRRNARAKPPSIAILPFASLSPEADDAYFAEGFVEDIVASLSNIPELLVVARGSTLALRRRATLDTAGVSGKLGVRYVLNGSVRRSATQLRIAVELTDAAEASVIWAERYDIGTGEIFTLQDEITLRVVAKVATSVRLAEVRRVLRKPPRSLNAYDHMLRALDLLYRMDFESFSRARELLERAREEDRDYAMPYAFSAQWHMFAIGEGWSSDPDADAAEMVRLAEAASQRDPSNALALAIHGHGRGMFFRDYDRAMELVDRAIAASPNSSWAWTFGAVPYGYIGKTEVGISRAERAIRLSPLDLQAFFNDCVLAQNHYLNGTYEDAVRWARRSVSLNPRFGNAVRVLAASLAALGHEEEAARAARHHREVLPGYRVSDYARRCPFHAPLAARYLAHLRAAGLPD